MRARAQKWGNSLAVRIPKALAERVGVAEGDELYIDVDADAIRLRPVLRPPLLAELLEGVTPENLPGETDFGVPVGREQW